MIGRSLQREQYRYPPRPRLRMVTLVDEGDVGSAFAVVRELELHARTEVLEREGSRRIVRQHTTAPAAAVGKTEIDLAPALLCPLGPEPRASLVRRKQRVNGVGRTREVQAPDDHGP